jgi:hypothetical protein
MNSCKRLARRLLIAKMPSLHTFVRSFVRSFDLRRGLHCIYLVRFLLLTTKPCAFFVHTYGTCYNHLIIDYIYRNVKGEVPQNTLHVLLTPFHVFLTLKKEMGNSVFVVADFFSALQMRDRRI